MRNRLFFLILIPVVLFTTAFSLMGVDRIMLKMESQSLQSGKTAVVHADLFYQALDGKLITRMGAPLKQVMITNRQGELTIYDQEKHTVYRTQGLEYSSENNLIFFFLTGKTQDLGLRDMGFSPVRPEFKDGLLITEWIPPGSVSHLFSKIEIVHEDQLPIYAGYYDAGGNLIRRVYYSNFEIFADVVLPLTVTEFNYLPEGDSIVNRVRFSDVKTNRQAVSAWFDFEIPDDAHYLD